MSLERADVERIAHLARIALDGDEAAALSGDLSGILRFVAQMDGVDTRGIAPMAHPLRMAQRLRADRVTEQDQRALFQSLAPEAECGLYLVPKVIE